MAALAVVVAGASGPVGIAPVATVGPARSSCQWAADVLPLPPGAFHGRVTAGAGTWFAGVAGADGANEAVRWRDDRVESLGRAFGLDTDVAAVNRDGVVVGTVTGPDLAQHAFVHDGAGYARLPETGGSSVALDVNARGDVVGHDGARLVVWPAGGRPRFLDMPAGEAPYGRAAIDDDGTVAARTGHVAAGALRWRGYVWTPDGTRLPVPEIDVQDVRAGQIVGTSGAPDGITVAAGLRVHGAHRSYLGGAEAVAVNGAGLVAGASTAGEPLVWDGALPTPLPAPFGHDPGAVTALNTDEAGGFTFPRNGDGATPVRWHCR